VENTNFPSGQELRLTRRLSAPQTRVFELWTSSRHLQQWWGPKGFTNPVCAIDPRSGGAIRIDMRSPDGTIYPMTGVVRELQAPEKIVFTGTALDVDGIVLFTILYTVLLTEIAGETELTIHALPPVPTPETKPFLDGMAMGWTQSLERLAAYAAET
jgi:uncharacterized protein YndB with AHSA1/START domain